MNIKRHAVASAIALFAFLVMTVLSASWGMPSLIAAAIVALASTVLYFHYRRRARVQALAPVTPARDDRVIPQDVKVAVSVRDKGQCQLRYPGICLGDRDLQFDHKWPWSKGGSSKDKDNIQLACKACNQAKSDQVPV